MQLQRYQETLPNGRKYDVLKATDSGEMNNTPDFLVPPGPCLRHGRQPRQFRRQPHDEL